MILVLLLRCVCTERQFCISLLDATPLDTVKQVAQSTHPISRAPLKQTLGSNLVVEENMAQANYSINKSVEVYVMHDDALGSYVYYTCTLQYANWRWLPTGYRTVTSSDG